MKTTTKTGKTNVGQALGNTADAAGNVGEKGVHAVKHGARKTARAAKRGAARLEAKTE